MSTTSELVTAEVVGKAPDDDLPYAFDFTRWGLLSTDALASGAVTCATAGLTIGSAGISGTKVTATISGGTNGTTYRLKVVGTTTAGRDLTGFVDLVVSEPEAAA